MPNTYELTTSLHNFAGDFMQNVFAYSLSEAGSGTPFEYAKALCDQWAAIVLSDYMKLFGVDVLCDFISAKRITGGGGPSAVLISTGTGGGAQDSVSAGLAFDIQWQTGSGTNRPGHTYIGAPPNGSIDGGQWQTGYKNDVDTFIATILNTLTLAGALGSADFGVFSRKLAQWNVCHHGVKKPKPTMLNKRTLPIL